MSSETLVERFIDSNSAIPYIKALLQQGHQLAEVVLQRRDIDSASVTTFLPRELPEEAIYAFTTGGKLPANPELTEYVQHGNIRSRLEVVPNTDSWLIDKIASFLRQGLNHICLIEDDLASPSDAGRVETDGLRMLSCDAHLYYALLSQDSGDRQLVERTIKEATSWRFIGVLSSLISAPEWPIGKGVTARLSQREIEEIADRTDFVIVNAYDGESYLVIS